MTRPLPHSADAAKLDKPRLGFLGVGWIGFNRMEAILNSGMGQVVGVADPSAEMVRQAAGIAPDAKVVSTFEELLSLDLDGVVIATPSALHAEQSIEALERGVAVFCQKPLGRSGAEVEAVVHAAEHSDSLLGADFSYRFTEGMRRIREIVSSRELGDIYAADLVFHNAYGPDKPWFYDPALSGGGCVMDLGVHLVDLALWTLDFPGVSEVNANLFAAGKPLGANPDVVEDYAIATLELDTGAAVRIACSWNLNAGEDAEISAIVHGTDGGAALRNVDGSFYDFMAERYRGTSREILSAPPDAWGGRAAVDWATRLATGADFDPAAWEFAEVARVLDRIYGRETIAAAV